jgi:type I restriction enzyme M protein
LDVNEDPAYSKYMDDAIFLISTANMLAKIADDIDKPADERRDTQGDLYEYLLSKIATAGTNGQIPNTKLYYQNEEGEE